MLIERRKREHLLLCNSIPAWKSINEQDYQNQWFQKGEIGDMKQEIKF